MCYVRRLISDYKIVFFEVVNPSRPSEPQDPHALVVLCEKELLAFDLTDKRHSQLTIAHTLDFHYTNITTISVFSNVSDDILSTITSLKSKQEVKEKINKQVLNLTYSLAHLS